MWKLCVIFTIAVLAKSESPKEPYIVVQPPPPPVPPVPVPPVPPVARPPPPIFTYPHRHHRDDSSEEYRYGSCTDCAPIKSTCYNSPRGHHCSKARITYFPTHNNCLRAVLSCRRSDDRHYTKIITKHHETLAEGFGIDKMVKCIDGRWEANDADGHEVDFRTVRCVRMREHDHGHPNGTSKPLKPSVHISSTNIFPCLLESHRVYMDVDGDSEFDEYFNAPLCNNCRPIHTTCRDHPGRNCSKPEIVYFMVHNRCTRAVVSCLKFSDDPQTQLITRENVPIAKGVGLEKMINCIDGRWTAKKWNSSDVMEFLSVRCII
ncbi:unnamed protein product [Cylicocyclus nassatus]|uniref:Uncharacterized protein n=1 Tax=Cylicocyclus nassatus TaxID=53992 RepID=A0AA36HF77_CYLNA|nr:unnamed protein product [Cylicocyclus nassatus]